MTLRDRIGFDAGSRELEEALDWAARHAFHYVDFNADVGPNHLDRWSPGRVRAVRDTCARHGIHLGLHTLSGVNVAEFSPHVAPAVDEYLKANTDLAVRLGCEWVVVHAGFHFSSAVEARQAASLERLKRLTGHAERVLQADGAYRWDGSATRPSSNPQEVPDFIARRRRFDPDLWVLELDVPSVERFTDEMNSIG